jgi:hypothetical protein
MRAGRRCCGTIRGIVVVRDYDHLAPGCALTIRRVVAIPSSPGIVMSMNTQSAVASAFLLLTSQMHAQGASEHPDVTRVWRMDTAKFAKHDAELAALTLSVRRLGDTLSIITDGVDVGRPPFQ